MTRNLASDLESRAVSDPTVTGLTFEDGRCWTYSGLDAAAGEIAARLLASGAPRGSRVAVQLANSPELVMTLLAAWKAGFVPVAMSGLYNDTEVAKCLAQVSPSVVISHAGVQHEGATALPLETVLQVCADHQGRGREFPRSTSAVEVSEDHEGIILFTGGSTGEPKAVSVTHAGSYGSMTNLVRAQKGRPGPLPTAGEEVAPNLLALPLFHSGGLQSLLVAIHLGRAVLLIERFSVDRLARLVPQYGVDNLFLLPTMIYDLVAAEASPDLSSVRRVLVAGQRLDPMLQQEFEKKYQVMVLSNYGSTELGHVAGWTGPDIRAGRWRAGAVGRVYDGVHLEIRNEEGDGLPPGEPGEIWIQSSRTKGYVDSGNATSSGLVVDGWIRSGDMGYVTEDRELYLVGRSRDLIKTGGFQVWPAELEQVVRTSPLVSDVAVVGLPDARLGEIPVAVVVTRGDDIDPVVLEDDIISRCREALAHYKAVRKVLKVDALPRSEVGKIRRDEVEATVLAALGRP